MQKNELLVLPALMGIMDVADYFGCSRGQVYRLIKRDPAFPAPIRAGKALRFKAADIAAWIDSQASRVG